MHFCTFEPIFTEIRDIGMLPNYDISRDYGNLSFQAGVRLQAFISNDVSYAFLLNKKCTWECI